MRAHVLQHVSFEGIGTIDRWLRELHAEVSFTRFYEDATLPDIDEVDLLIVMGGPMSVNDEAEYGWLVAEKEFIRAAIQAEVSVLGICLGAQLIASALGAPVYPNSEREIGWFPIFSAPGVAGATFQFPGEMTVFHWHGETFDLPSGTTLLASSSGCKNQAFQWGSWVIGLQFHLEVTPESIAQMIDHCSESFGSERYVQSESELRAATPAMYAGAHQLMEQVLDYLVVERFS